MLCAWCSECSEEHPCEGLNKHAHFRNFGMAFLTLFRVATGDNWNGIMKVHFYDTFLVGFTATFSDFERIVIVQGLLNFI